MPSMATPHKFGPRLLLRLRGWGRRELFSALRRAWRECDPDVARGLFRVVAIRGGGEWGVVWAMRVVNVSLIKPGVGWIGLK